MKIFHSSTDNRIGGLLSVYKGGTFCLCPPGDDPGRKAVFDSIVSGCIPVVSRMNLMSILLYNYSMYEYMYSMPSNLFRAHRRFFSLFM